MGHDIWAIYTTVSGVFLVAVSLLSMTEKEFPTTPELSRRLNKLNRVVAYVLLVISVAMIKMGIQHL